MRRLILVICLCMTLCSCASSQQVENQAYVIAMGVDRTESGKIELCVQVPKNSGGAESSNMQSGVSGSYLPLSVKAEDYEHALELLSWAVPRDLNLSQIKMIVLSRRIAQGEDCRDLIARIYNTERLFSAANVVICDGSATDFIKALTPKLGSRLSTSIEATLDHYKGLGVLPECTLANLNFRSNSFYSDPIAGYAVLKKAENAAQPAAALSGTPQEITEASESDIETRYLGAAVFRDGTMRGELHGDDAILANLICGTVQSFRYICGGESLEFSPVGSCDVNVDTKTEPAKIRLEMTLAISDQEFMPNSDLLQDTIGSDMRRMISKVQEMEVEPFGFAEVAAQDFLTMTQWEAYDWQKHFTEAEIEIKLHFTHSDT